MGLMKMTVQTIHVPHTDSDVAQGTVFPPPMCAMVGKNALTVVMKQTVIILKTVILTSVRLENVFLVVNFVMDFSIVKTERMKVSAKKLHAHLLDLTSVTLANAFIHHPIIILGVMGKRTVEMAATRCTVKVFPVQQIDHSDVGQANVFTILGSAIITVTVWTEATREAATVSITK